MKIPPALGRFLLLTGLVLALPTYSSAQGYATKTDVPLGAAKTAPFTLEIRHGIIMENGKQVGEATVGSVLDYFDKKGEKFNIILGPGVSDLRISDLVLNYDWNESDGSRVFLTAIAEAVGDQVEANRDDMGVFRLTLRQDTSRQIQVFNLTGYLNPDGKADEKAIQEKLASLTDIIFKTLKDLDPTFSDVAQPRYQYYKGANLLVVTGTHEDVAVANKIIEALTHPEGGNNPFAAVADGTRRAQNLAAILSALAQNDPQAALQSAQAQLDDSATLFNNNQQPQSTWTPTLRQITWSSNDLASKQKAYAAMQDYLKSLQAEAQNNAAATTQVKELQDLLDNMKLLMEKRAQKEKAPPSATTAPPAPTP